MSFDFLAGVFATITAGAIIRYYEYLQFKKELAKVMQMLVSNESAKSVRLEAIKNKAKEANVDLVTFRIPYQEYFFDDKERVFKTELKEFGNVIASGVSRQWIVITLATTSIENALRNNPDIEIKTPDF